MTNSPRVERASPLAVIFVAQDGELGVEVAIDEAGQVVRIETGPMMPVELLDGADFEHVLPLLDKQRRLGSATGAALGS